MALFFYTAPIFKGEKETYLVDDLIAKNSVDTTFFRKIASKVESIINKTKYGMATN